MRSNILVDDGGIYKGRLNHRERVREIDDTRDTKVDLPVDYREVETVEVCRFQIIFNQLISLFDFRTKTIMETQK